MLLRQWRVKNNAQTVWRVESKAEWRVKSSAAQTVWSVDTRV